MRWANSSPRSGPATSPVNSASRPRENLTNHVAYLANWLKAMKDDPKFIFTASSQASKAADYLLSFSRPTADEPEAEAVLAG